MPNHREAWPNEARRETHATARSAEPLGLAVADVLAEVLEDRLPGLLRQVMREVLQAELRPLLDHAPNADEQKSKLLSVEEVSRHCGVTEPTVREWIKAGELPALRPGGGRHYRVRPDDLETFLQKRRSASNSPDDRGDVTRLVDKVLARMAAKKE